MSNTQYQATKHILWINLQMEEISVKSIAASKNMSSHGGTRTRANWPSTVLSCGENPAQSLECHWIWWAKRQRNMIFVGQTRPLKHQSKQIRTSKSCFGTCLYMSTTLDAIFGVHLPDRYHRSPQKDLQTCCINWYVLQRLEFFFMFLIIFCFRNRLVSRERRYLSRLNTQVLMTWLCQLQCSTIYMKWGVLAWDLTACSHK